MGVLVCRCVPGGLVRAVCVQCMAQLAVGDAAAPSRPRPARRVRTRQRGRFAHRTERCAAEPTLKCVFVPCVGGCASEHKAEGPGVQATRCGRRGSVHVSLEVVCGAGWAISHMRL